MPRARMQGIEAELDGFIERRANQREKARELSDMWRESERKDRERRQREGRAAWYGFHCHMRELHAQLAAEHAQRASALLEEPGGGG